MSSSDHQYSADERFERLLLDSARNDEMPRNVDAAWQRFDSALHGASALAAGVGGALAVRRAQRWLAVKWLIWGALAGSAVTAFSLRAHFDRRAEVSAMLAVPVAVPAVASSTAQVLREVEAAKPEAAPPIEKVANHSGAAAHSSLPRRKPTPEPAQEQVPTAQPEQAPEPAPSSTLAAQVALLDAARSALASGTYSEAVRLADRYRKDFPNGELSPEAETVAIEALLARNERALALERATRFLLRYPGDPHAARVKWLAR